MSRLILDESLLAKLPMLSEPAEICDRTGRRLGWFCPTSPSHRASSSFSDEELERLRHDPENQIGKPWTEVKQWLDQLSEAATPAQPIR